MNARTSKALVRCILVLGGLSSGCGHCGPESQEAPLNATCVTHTCQDLYERLPGYAPEVVKGSSFEIRDFGCFCRLDVSWPVSAAHASRFHAMIDAQMDEVIPLRLGFAELYHCERIRSEVPVSRPYAILVLDPEVATLPQLDPDDVFIPLDGDAVLDETVYATAEIDPAPDGGHGPPSVTVVLGAAHFHEGQSLYPGLHEGDSFRWGDTDAKILRIVPVRSARVVPVGWVEVSLAPRTPAAPT